MNTVKGLAGLAGWASTGDSFAGESPAFLHPFDFLHAEPERLSAYVVGAVLGVVGWHLLDAAIRRRGSHPRPAPNGKQTPGGTAGRSGRFPRLIGARSVRPAAIAARLSLPFLLRVIVLLLALHLAESVLDYAHGVAGIVVFGGTIELALVNALVEVFATLPVAGAALILVAPRAAAVAFALTALIGVFLGVAHRWRVEFGLERNVLSLTFTVSSQHFLEWAILAAALAALAVFSLRRSPVRTPNRSPVLDLPTATTFPSRQTELTSTVRFVKPKPRGRP